LLTYAKKIVLGYKNTLKVLLNERLWTYKKEKTNQI
jgi:hypothetical protein